MTTLVQSLREINKPWQWISIAVGILLLWVFVSLTTLHRHSLADLASTHSQEAVDSYAAPPETSRAVPVSQAEAAKLEVANVPGATTGPVIDRKIIRTSSLEMVVEHPSEVAMKVSALSEEMGGYLETATIGGQNATSGTVTIRVPASRFEQARAEIRKLGLRVENEKVDAQDVSRQYVDQDARIRNLRAEEAQFLAILKQATTVKDLLAVNERLSEVRGEIERQQAEFNALSRQIETVSIAITLRSESEAQVFGLNWRPGYELKLALHDGLDSVATYASTMTTILFYMPAVLLWAGTILITIVTGWRVTQWIGKRWFAARTEPVSARGGPEVTG